MQQLIFFIRKYKYFLYFLLLQIIAFSLTINNHSFHKSKFVSSANYITGGINNKTSSISEYLNLKSENTILVEENKQLKNKVEKLLFSIKNPVTSPLKDTLNPLLQFEYVNGKTIANEYSKTYNYLTINRGKNHGIKPEMAVVNSKGIIGITDYSSNKYSRVQSILNKNSKINAKFKNSDHFGTLTWNAKDYNIVQLEDIPRQAVYKTGDTIITGGKSTIFPEGILIGTILENLESASALNVINIKLFNDMSNIGPIYTIKNFDKEEIENLETNFNE